MRYSNASLLASDQAKLLAILIGVFLISFSSLMLEVTITRIFSTTIWYHFAFMAISVALLGWGLGGILLYFLRQKFNLSSICFSAVIASLFSISIPVYIWTILQSSMSPSNLTAYYLISIVPFALGGMSMSFLFDFFADQASKIYFADLVGASFGSLSIEPTLVGLGAESAALALGVTTAIGGIFLALVSKKRRIVGLSLICLIATSAILISNSQLQFITISNAPTKRMFRDLENFPESHIVYTKWNSFSRIDVVEGLPDSLATIYIDADALSIILEWDGVIESVAYLEETLDFIPYRFVSKPKSLIIGSGGGRDVVIALVGNSSEVIAVELNPIIVEATRSYGENAGNVYDQDKVYTVVDEGRSFIGRSDTDYDIVTLTLVDSWAAIMSGGYALAENYLYTLEAFKEYIDHLTDDGILMMIRWHNEIPRLVSTTVTAFQARDLTIPEVGKRVIVILDESDPRIKSLFMVKRSPWTTSQVEEIENWINTSGPNYRIRYAPYSQSEKLYSDLFNNEITLEQFYSNFSYPVQPVTDDSPYFFNWEHPIPSSLGDLITLTLAFAIIVITLPLIIKRRHFAKFNDGEFTFIIYFAALGLAYMLIEIALIQKYILFLGYPTRALSVIIFSLLLSSGIGSFFSRWISEKTIIKNVLFASPLIVVLLVSYILFMPSLFAFFLMQESSIRILLTVLMLFPLGFLMGIPFPTGLRILASSSSKKVPWMWAINGAMSVLGSILATAVGMIWGFSYAMIIAGLAYLTTLLVALYWWRTK